MPDKRGIYGHFRVFITVQMTWECSHCVPTFRAPRVWRFWCRFSLIAAGNAWLERMVQKPEPIRCSQVLGRTFVPSFPQERRCAVLNGGVLTGRAQTVAQKPRVEPLGSPQVDAACPAWTPFGLEIATKLLNRDFANLAQRVQGGGKLRRAERAMLQGMAAEAGQAPTVAENYVELAKLLGVARRTLQNWRERKDAPKAGAGGFHEVAAWREFMRRHGLEGDPAGTDAESALRARKLLAEVEERELRLAVKKREYIALGQHGCYARSRESKTDFRL